MPGQKQMDVVMSIMGRVDKLLPKGIQDIAAKVGALEKELIKNGNAQDKLTRSQNDAYNKIKKMGGEYARNAAEIRRLNAVKQNAGALSAEEQRQLAKLEKENAKLAKTMHATGAKYTEYKARAKGLADEHNNLQRELQQTANEMKKTANMNGVGNVSRMGNRMVGGAARMAGKAALATGAAGLAAGAYVGKQSASAYMEFEGAMKRVQAITMGTAEDYAILEKRAMQMGATTKFTAAESAAAMEKMALAGFKTQEIYDAIPGVLDLAAAAGEDVAMVSDIITDALVPFNMTAKDTGRFADVLAYTMSRTNTDVGMVGEAFKYASGGAKTLGVSLEDTAGALGLMADQAIKGSQAGTSLNNIFVMAAKNQGKLKKAGIKVTGKNGDFVGLVSMMEQVEKATAKMGNIQKEAFLVDMFGKKGAQGLMPLLNAEKEIDGVMYKGAAAVKAQIEATKRESTGASEKMKDIMLQGASGAKILLLSAWDEFKVALGKIIFSPWLLGQMKKLTKTIGIIANVLSGTFTESDMQDKQKVFWYQAIVKVRMFIEKLKEAIKPGIEIIKSWIPKNAGTNFFDILSKSVLFLGKAFSKIMAVADKVLSAIKYLGADNVAVFAGVFLVITNIITAFNRLKAAGGIIGWITKGFSVMGGPVTLIIAGVALLITGIYLLYKNWDKVKAKIIEVKDKALELWDKVAGFWASMKEEYPILQLVENGIRLIGAPIFALIDAAKEFWTHWKEGDGIVGSLLAAFGKFFGSLWQTFKTWVDDILNEIAKIPAKAIESAKNFFIGRAGKAPVVDPSDTFAGTIYGVTSNAKGLANVPFDNYLSYLHAGERVLTAAENRSFTSLFGSQIGAINKRGGILDRVSTTAANYNTSNTYKNGDNSESFSFSIGNITIGGNADAGIASQIGEEIAKRVRIELKKRDDAKHDRERRKL